MIRYIPPFILNNYEQNVLEGSLDAYVLLVDIADFTKIGTTLQKEGKQGAEELSRFLDIAFCNPIEIVSQHGGFISIFAGDAFCAIFPDSRAENIISVVNSISSFFLEQSTFKTLLGEFDLKARQTISYGNIDWQIFVNELQNEYVFSGDTLKEVADLSSNKEDVVFSESAMRNIGESSFEKYENGYRITNQCIIDEHKPHEFQYSSTTKSNFINPKYKTEVPQNEIRSAAYCFANLERIDLTKREESIAMIQKLADKYGGFVNKYDATDKGMIAIILFGLPKSDGKTLERICSFSLETVESISGIALGISCGSVFAGYTGSGEVKEYTALGYPMNLAARLMSKARTGEVLADTFLWQEMQVHYDFDYLGSLNLKGIAQPLRYYQLSRPSKDKAWHQESRFVGRDEELTQIRKTLDHNLETKANTIIYVAGDAGIGKSRLVKETLAVYSANAFHKFFITCDSILPKPLEASKQIVRTFFYYNPQMPQEAGIAMFKGLWLSLAMGDAEMQRIESIIASLLGYEWEGSVWSILPPEDKPSQLKNAFIRFMEQLTRTKPVLIHLDDGQWIDEESKNYLQSLSEKEISPIMIVNSCRYLDNGEKADLGLSQYREVDIDLNSLSDNTSLELISTSLRLEHVPEETSNLIITRAMGNPFFIEQLTSYLMESGCINDKGIISGDVGYLSSFSISDIISSRIDRLTEQVRECMFNASVLGMQFNVKVLTQMLNHQIDNELEIGTINRIWKDLDEIRYIFSHILIKDVVYQRMMSEKLQILHQTAAESMELVIADKLDENAEEIAHHFEKGNQMLKAAEYYDKAGCWFMDKFDFAHSSANLIKAIQIRETFIGLEHSDTAKSLFSLASLYHSQAKYDQAEIYYLKVLAIQENVLGTEHPEVAEILNTLAGLYGDLGKFTEAELLLMRSLEIFERSLKENYPIKTTTLTNLGWFYEYQSNYDQAELYHIRALVLQEKIHGNTHPETAETLLNLAALYTKQGKYNEAEQLLLRALEINENILGLMHPNTAETLSNLAYLYRCQGKYKESELQYLRTLDIRKNVFGEDHPYTARTIFMLASLFMSQRKYNQAEQLYLRAKDIREKMYGTYHPSTANSYKYLAILYKAQGLFDKSESLFLKSLEIREKVMGVENPWTKTTLEEIIDLYEKMGQPDKAAEYRAKLDEIQKKED